MNNLLKLAGVGVGTIIVWNLLKPKNNEKPEREIVHQQQEAVKKIIATRQPVSRLPAPKPMIQTKPAIQRRPATVSIQRRPAPVSTDPFSRPQITYTPPSPGYVPSNDPFSR